MKDVRIMIKETWGMFIPYLLLVVILLLMQLWEPLQQIIHFYLVGDDVAIDELNWKVPLIH